MKIETIINMTNPTSHSFGFQALAEDSLWHASQVARFYFSISMAYFIGNLIISVVMFRAYGALFLLHAVAALAALAVCVFGQRFHYYGCMGLLWESSNLFLNARWLLREYGVRSRWLAAANGYALAVVFGVTRILFGLPLLLSLWSDLAAARGAGRLGRAHFTALTALIATLAAINAVWFKKLLHKLLAPRTAHRPRRPATARTTMSAEF
jgi:hypothetical protein